MNASPVLFLSLQKWKIKKNITRAAELRAKLVIIQLQENYFFFFLFFCFFFEQGVESSQSRMWVSVSKQNSFPPGPCSGGQKEDSDGGRGGKRKKSWLRGWDCKGSWIAGHSGIYPPLNQLSVGVPACNREQAKAVLSRVPAALTGRHARKAIRLAPVRLVYVFRFATLHRLTMFFNVQITVCHLPWSTGL